MKKSERPRVLLADDFPKFLEQTEKLLRDDCEIVGFARDGAEALRLCLTLNPDILLLDLSMPVLCGLQVASRIKQFGCRSKIIIVTVQQDREYVEAAFSLGVSGYILKGRMATDLLPAINNALRGDEFTSPFRAQACAIRR